MLYECDCFWLSSSNFSVRTDWINRCISDITHLQKALSLSAVHVLFYDAGGGATEAALLAKLEKMGLKITLGLHGESSDNFLAYVEKRYPQANTTISSDFTLHFACDTNTPHFTSHAKRPFKDFLTSPGYYASLWATENTESALHNALHGCLIDHTQIQYHFCSSAGTPLYAHANVKNWCKKRVAEVVLTTPPQVFWHSSYRALYDKDQKALESVFTHYSFEHIAQYTTMLVSACATQS